MNISDVMKRGNVKSIRLPLDHVDLEIEKGDFIAILGHNGSGKSTLAKHINALLAPSGVVLGGRHGCFKRKNVWDSGESLPGWYFRIRIIRSWAVSWRRMLVRTGKPRCADQGNLATCGGEFKGSRNVKIPSSF